MKKLILASLTCSLLLSCGESEKKPSIEDLEATKDSLKTISETQKTEFTEEEKAEITQIFNSIPSPLEMSFLIKSIGSEYDVSYLNPSENVLNYTDTYDKALNLGIYGSDLAYTNIYNQNQDGLAYLSNVRSLAKDLSIDQFFASEVLTNLIKNSNNLDSLLVITTSNFEKINLHLQNQNREQLSVLLLTGGWIEGLSLACNVYNDKPNAELKDKIGEQKAGLEQLLQLLDYYKEDNKIAPFIADLKKLNEAYDAVKIEVIEGEPEIVEQDGIMMVVDNSETVISYSEEDFQNISATVKDIRKNIIE